jgi:RNA-directed DNA polymerase
MSALRTPTRAEILARIAASTKEKVVLEEMQRLGFWPASATKPTLEASLIERESQLRQELQSLHQTLHKLGDPEAALAAMRKERMADARARREQTAQRHARERYERASRFFEAQRTQIHYLGLGVSNGFWVSQKQVPKALSTLPQLGTPLEIAQSMGISMPELKFLSYHREVGTVSHYHRFAIPKKIGGVRWISAPLPRLKRAQYWVLDNILTKVPVHAAAHGFLPGRSIVSNASPHAGQAVVINLDLKDFFPSIKFPRIKGAFRVLGYSEPVATVLALLTSENVSDAMEVDGEQFYVGHAARERQLPQGAPTSPMLTNILCRTLDKRLAGLARQLGFSYTRYADDLTFSAQSKEKVGELLRRARWIISDEGFTPHPDKQHVMHAGRQQTVTGLVVNKVPAAPRSERRKLRAALHQAQQNQPGDTAKIPTPRASWGGTPASPHTLLGYARFVAMVSPKQGMSYVNQARALVAKQKLPTVPALSPYAAAFRSAAAAGNPPPRAGNTPWWTPAQRAAPELEKTAGQLREERLARLREARRTRDVAAGRARPLSGSTAPESQPNSNQNSVPPGKPKINLYAWAWFVFLFSFLAIAFKSRSFVVAGVAWAGYAFFARKPTWGKLAITVIAAVVIERLVFRG